MIGAFGESEFRGFRWVSVKGFLKDSDFDYFNYSFIFFLLFENLFCFKIFYVTLKNVFKLNFFQKDDFSLVSLLLAVYYLVKSSFVTFEDSCKVFCTFVFTDLSDLSSFFLLLFCKFYADFSLHSFLLVFYFYCFLIIIQFL